MKAHHVLMIEKNKAGDVVAAHEVPNNEWARCRRKGWEFATAEEQALYATEQADALKALKAEEKEKADAEAKERGKKKPPAGGKSKD